MPWSIFRSVTAHHSETPDPDLLEWIKGLVDHLLGGGPWTMVAGLGLLMLLMPLSVVVLYVVQQRRHSAADPRRPDQEET